MTQIMGEIVKVADTCTSGGRALQDEPNERHRRHSLDASGLRLLYHTCQQAYQMQNQEHLSSCIPKFAIAMPGNARRGIDNTRPALEKRTRHYVAV